MDLQVPLYSPEQVRELDRVAIEVYDIPGIELMRRAGKSAFNALRARWPQARVVSIYCGAGNNAGDGYIVAQLAHQAGLSVTVWYARSPDLLSGDALIAAKDAIAAGVRVVEYSKLTYAQCFEGADVIVDALLGTGISRPIESDYEQLVSHINTSDLPVLALDVPSGLCANTGAILGAAVAADCTITFIGRKCGLYTGAASAFVGEVIFDDLAVPKFAYTGVQSRAVLMSLDSYSRACAVRSVLAHKGNCGHVLVLGGDYGFAGAALMSASAAARVGAGLISCGTRAEHISALVSALPECMSHVVDSNSQLETLLARATVIVIGPGLGQGAWARWLFNAAVASKKTLVIDADALHLLREIKDLQLLHNNWVLTPHPGEAAMLLGWQTDRVQADRFSAAAEICRLYGGIVVLKGAGTIVANSSVAAEEGASANAETCFYVCPYGNAGMASGGMGDILAGTISGLLAQHHDANDAVGLAVCIHSHAADLAAQRGCNGLLASDLLPYIRQLAD